MNNVVVAVDLCCTFMPDGAADRPDGVADRRDVGDRGVVAEDQTGDAEAPGGDRERRRAIGIELWPMQEPGHGEHQQERGQLAPPRDVEALHAEHERGDRDGAADDDLAGEHGDAEPDRDRVVDDDADDRRR